MTARIEIKRHPDGTRYVRPYLGTNAVTGKPLRPYRRFSDSLTDAECEREAEAWLESISPATGRRVGTALGDLLALYVGDLEAQGAPYNTVRTYRTLSRYAGPLAARDARDVKVWEVEELYNGLLAGGGSGGSGLSPETVIAFHWFLRGCYSWLVSIGLVPWSPVALAAHPSHVRAEAVSLTAGEFVALNSVLEGAMPDGLRAADPRSAAAMAAYLALNLGLRCGEACALLHGDVWADRMLVHVGATAVEVPGGVRRQAHTKGKRARNVAATDDDLTAIGRAASSRRVARLRDGGDGGGASGSDAPVVTADGAMMRPSTVSRLVRGIFREAGVRDEVTFHSLRHTHATWLLSHGMDLKTVAERLGHADESTTLRTYAHTMPGRDAAAAELFARIKREGA